MKKTSRLSQLYMGAVLLLPVLAQYSILNGQLDMDVVAMLLLLGAFLLSKHQLRVRNVGFSATIIGYIMVVTIVNLLFGKLYTTTTSVIMRSVRYCVYLFIVLFVAMDEVDYGVIMRIYRVIAYLAFGYITVQTVAYYGFGIMLPSKLGAQSSAAVDTVGRLRAFYSEPADMSYSMIPFIVCSLFGPRYKEKDKRFADAIVVTAAVLMTTSSQGSLCVMVLWVIWFVLQILNRTVTAKSVLAALGAVVVIVVLYRTGILDYSLNRLDVGGSSNAWAARSGGYTALKLLSPVQRLFGTGYGNYISENAFGLDTYGEYVNYSSIAENLFTLGYIGTGLILMLLLNALKKSQPYQKILLLTMLFLSVGGCPFTGKYMPLYFCLIMCQINEAECGFVQNGKKQLEAVK